MRLYKLASQQAVHQILIFAPFFYLLKDLSGWVFGDKGYLMNEAKLAFVEYDNTIDFFAKPRNNAKKKSVKETPTMAKMEMPDFVKQPTVFGIYIS